MTIEPGSRNYNYQRYRTPNRRFRSAVVTASLAVVVLGGASASAAPQVIEPIDTGWYWLANSGYLHQPSNTNFIVGHDDVSNTEYRDFFVFDLSTIHEPIASATFQADVTDFGVAITVGTVGTWTLYDVTTSITALRNASTLSTTFADLGTGQVFGVLKFTRDDRGHTVTVDLNSTAIASMNASGGALWAFGGRVDDLGNGADILFNGSEPSNSKPRMFINGPEPSGFVMALLGCGAVGSVRRMPRHRTGRTSAG
jgi:hypothetical protein